MVRGRAVMTMCFVGILLLSDIGYAQADSGAESIVTALIRRVTVWVDKLGRQVSIGHCRAAHSGCHARLALYGKWIYEAASAYNVDPWLLAGIAVTESGLDPYRQGKAGEGGIMQLHPRGPGRDIAFVRSDRARNACRLQAGDCQREIIDRAAETLQRGFRVCNGDGQAALGYYNTGRCQDTEYATRVMHQASRLQSYSGS